MWGPRWTVCDFLCLVGLIHPQKSPGPLLPPRCHRGRGNTRARGSPGPHGRVAAGGEGGQTLLLSDLQAPQISHKLGLRSKEWGHGGEGAEAFSPWPKVGTSYPPCHTFSSSDPLPGPSWDILQRALPSVPMLMPTRSDYLPLQVRTEGQTGCVTHRSKATLRDSARMEIKVDFLPKLGAFHCSQLLSVSTPCLKQSGDVLILDRQMFRKT